MDTPKCTEVTEATSSPLPTAALSHVLHRVDTKQRLDACARVCRAWRAASVTATRRVELLGCTQHKTTALGPWLAANAGLLGRLESITVSARFDGRILAADAWVNTPDSTWRMPELLLPYQHLSNLTQLSLKLIKCPLAAAAAAATGGRQHQLPASLGPGCSSTGSSTGSSSDGKAPAYSLAALTALKALSVTDCVIHLEGLPALTGLESLQLSQGWGGGPALGAAAAAAAPRAVPACVSVISGSAAAAAALPHLTLLTHLTLAGSCCTPEAFLHVHTLQHLQELVLGWAQLPQPVVAGSEAWCNTGITLDDTTLPGLAKLTLLRKLVVSGAVEAVDPALLQGLPASLLHLQLDDVRLVMMLGQPRGAALAGLQQLQQLEHLSINHKRGPLSFLAPEDCMALTASSKLTHLSLTGCQLPGDGCSRMFGAEWQLPFLERLEAAPSLLTDPAAVALLSLCCPKLRSVAVQLPSAAPQRLVGPVDLSGLAQMSGLTQLVLLGVSMAGSPGFRALGQLTGLVELSVSAVRGFRLADVMQLTACKELRQLKLAHMQLTEVLAASLCLTHQGGEDGPANVCAQIPPALLKQALWLFPFRSLPADDELQQVSELVNAQQMHYLVDPSPPNTLGPLQQQIISLTQALLQLQQQRRALAGALGGALGGHPMLQQLQQQTQALRNVLMGQIADLQECITDPSHLARLRSAAAAPCGAAGLPAGINNAAPAAAGAPMPGLTPAAALSAAAAAQMQLQQQQQQQQLMSLMQGAGGHASELGFNPLLLQQQLQLQQALQALQAAELLGGPLGGLGGFQLLQQQHHNTGGLNPFMALPAPNMTPAMGRTDPSASSNLCTGGLAGGPVSGTAAAAALAAQVAAVSGPLQQLRQPFSAADLLGGPQPNRSSKHSAGGVHGSEGGAAAGFAPLLQQHQQQQRQSGSTATGLPSAPAAGSSQPAQAQKETFASSASSNGPPVAGLNLSRPPGLTPRLGLTPRGNVSRQNTPRARNSNNCSSNTNGNERQQQHQQRQAGGAQAHHSSGLTQQQQLLLAAQRLGMSAGDALGMLPAGHLQLSQQPPALSLMQHLQQQQQQPLFLAQNDQARQLMQQSSIQSSLQDLLAQQQQLAQLQVLAGLQDSLAGLRLPDNL